LVPPVRSSAAPGLLILHEITGLLVTQSLGSDSPSGVLEVSARPTLETAPFPAPFLVH
jgi:hypothetical protein